MTNDLPVVQFAGRPGTIDLAWGHPHPEALPVAAWADAVSAALRRHGARALTYGYAAGPGPMIEWLCARLAEVDRQAPDPDQVFVTAGASAGLELVATSVAASGSVAIVDSPTYHLALRTLADRGLELVPAPSDDAGLDPERAGDLVGSLRRQGRRVSLVYLVPTFNNPTGRSLAPDRRAALVEWARRDGLIIVEDDTYRELCFDPPAPSSLFSQDATDVVIRIGSFSKSVAPGIRLGFITADADRVRTFIRRGHVDSGGGLNHTSALAMAEFGASGGFARHVDALRRRYARQRDALSAALATHLPDASFAVPDGGWFLWLRMPDDGRAAVADLSRHLNRCGVGLLPGTTFFPAMPGNRPGNGAGDGSDRIRLSYSRYGTEDLAEGARRLGRAWAQCRSDP